MTLLTLSRSLAPLLGLSAALIFFSGCIVKEPAHRAEPAPMITAAEAEAVVAAPGVLSTEPWTFAGNQGKLIRTAHYRIYTTEKNPVVRDRMVDFVEHALAHYRSGIAPLPAPPQRLDTYLMDSRPQWDMVTKLLMGKQGEELTKIQRGGFASRGIGVYYDLGLYDTMAIAAHEGWHQYTQRTFGEPLPVWLEEGVATYMEGHRWSRSLPEFKPWANVERFDQLRKAKEQGAIARLPELLESSPQGLLNTVDGSLLNYYAQVWALVHFLDEAEGGKYRPALAALLTDASEGKLSRTVASRLGNSTGRGLLSTRSGPAVFLAYFNDNLDAAAVEYDKFVSAIVDTGSRTAIVSGRSPIDP